MDVESLRNELEGHLKNNPDEHAPTGFRDRFEATIEDMEAADSDESRAELEAQLHQIRVEAEVAVKCGCDDGEASAPTESREDAAAEAPAPKGDVDDSDSIVAAAPDPEIVEAKTDDRGAEPIVEAREDPGQGLMQRYGIMFVVALIVVVAAAYYLRG